MIYSIIRQKFYMDSEVKLLVNRKKRFRCHIYLLDKHSSGLC